jgi:DNA (cytosine-5)-methyltransferase 1
MDEEEGKLTVVDLFAGIGGFRLGFERAGFTTVYSNDFDKSCKVSFDGYFGEGALDLRDITTIEPDEIPYADVITGGFPCQPFSKIGKLHGFADARGTLFFDVLRILEAKRPKAFVLENVKNLIRHDGGNTFKVIIDNLENVLGYTVYFQVLNTKDFGLPQDRKRIYIVGFRDKIDISYPKPIKLHKFVKDILEDGPIDDSYFLSQKYMDGLENHKQRHASRGHGFGYKILKPEGISTALVVGNMGRERNLIQDVPRPLGTLARSGGPVNTRGIRKYTVREGARLQGFPDDYEFNVPVTQAYKQIGNAVSVPVAQAVAERVREVLTQPVPVRDTVFKDTITDLFDNSRKVVV